MTYDYNDYTKFRRILLDEFCQEQRRSNAESEAFNLGMVRFENYLTWYDETRLNDSVPEQTAVRRLEERLQQAQVLIGNLRQKLDNERKALQNFMYLNKEQKKKLKENNYIAELTQKIESLQRLNAQLIMEKTQ